ncbi:MAG: Maf family protein [Candidatus Poseidoniaceae archaeon]|nr:Maf family protein [Candidatus Poseidoniaceae archaeon]
MGDSDTVWLASKSPRRAQLLRELFPNIVCQGIEGVDEKPPSGEVEYQVLEICKKKARAADLESQIGDYDVVIVCDTMLCDPDDSMLSLGKPMDEIEAAMMLHRLSGRRHQVWSATGIKKLSKWKFYCESSIVEITPLPDEALVELILSKSWHGKAGGYDLAGPMGQWAKLIDGSESTVLGIASQALIDLQQ